MLYKSDRNVHLYYEKDKNFAQNKFDWWKLKFKYIALHPGKKNFLSLEKSNLVLLIILFTPRPYLFNVRNETIFNGGRIHPITVPRNRAEFTTENYGDPDARAVFKRLQSDRQWRPTLKRAKSLRRIEPAEEEGRGGEG